MAWRQVQARFGPDVQWVDHIDYAVDESRKAAIRRYWAHLPDGTLQPAYCGVRPKTVGPSGQSRATLLIRSSRDQGLTVTSRSTALSRPVSQHHSP